MREKKYLQQPSLGKRTTFITIDFGTPTPTIAQQLREQKLRYDSEFIKSLEKSRQAIATLFWNGLIDSKQEQQLKNRLTQKINNHVWKRK